MKKLFLGSIALTVFSISMLIFQISCQKTVDAQPGGSNYVLPPATTATLGGVIVDGTTIKVDATGKISTVSSTTSNSGSIILYNRRSSSTAPDEIWRANIDGSGQQKINISLPAELELNLSDGGAIKVTPDNQIIIFQVRNISTNQAFFYSCSIDGTNAKKIIDGPLDGGLELGSVN